MNRYGYMTNVPHTLDTKGKTIPVSADNPFPVDTTIGTVVEGASTQATRNANIQYTTDTIDVLEFTSITISVSSDVDSAMSGVSIQFSTDGSDWHETDTYTYYADSMKTWTVQRVARYFRVVYTNGSFDQTHFDFSTIANSTAGVASSHRIGDTLSNEDDAQLTKAVLSGQTPLLEQVNIQATPDGEIKTSVITPVGSLPVSQLTTLHDGKTLNRLFPEIYESAGTGTGTFQTNKYNMDVTSGQWMVYASKRFLPYYAGKPQKVELTFDKFAPQTNITKRVGYFSSSTASPFSTSLDGFYLESGSGTITFNIMRNGTTVLSVDITNWDGYDLLNGYKTLSTWDNFTVIEFNFLWLGGAYIELKLVTSEGFTTVHKLFYVGTAQDVFIQSPNQTVRYEIRSTTGSGSFRAICSQVATSGSISESSYSKSTSTGTSAITCGSIGTTYPILGIRKGTTYRQNPIRISNADILVSSNDNVRWSIHVNPTLSAGLTYNPVANSAAEVGIGNGSQTVTAAGTIPFGGYIVQGYQIQPEIFKSNFMSWLSGQLNGTQDQYILCVTPLTTNVSVFANIIYLEG